MPDRVPAGCYAQWPWPPSVLPLWNDDVDGITALGFENSIGKAAERNVFRDIVAAFSGINGAIARIEKRGAGDHWVINRL